MKKVEMIVEEYGKDLFALYGLTNGMIFGNGVKCRYLKNGISIEYDQKAFNAWAHERLLDSIVEMTKMFGIKTKVNVTLSD